jgi:hypothetical protein
MPQEIQHGSAVLHGIRNNGTAIDIGYDAFIETAKVEHKFDEDTVKDQQGADASWIGTNERLETEITLVPKGTTRALAEAATVILTPFQTIEFSNFAVDLWNTTWGYIGGQTVELPAGKPGKVSLKFRMYVDEDQNTAFATTVTG